MVTSSDYHFVLFPLHLQLLNCCNSLLDVPAVFVPIRYSFPKGSWLKCCYSKCGPQTSKQPACHLATCWRCRPQPEVLHQEPQLRRSPSDLYEILSMRGTALCDSSPPYDPCAADTSVAPLANRARSKSFSMAHKDLCGWPGWCLPQKPPLSPLPL